MALRHVAIGAWLGLLVLGVGGRVVMRVIALAAGSPGAITASGTATVLAAGTGAGVAGALLHALSRVAARRVGGRAWVRLLVFAVLLGLATARGLRGSPAGPSALFWPLVALYGFLIDRALAGRTRAAPRASAPVALPTASRASP